MKKLVLLTVSLIILVFLTACNSTDRVIFEKGQDKIDVKIDGTLFTSYMTSEELTKPILYPVFTPSGIKVNRSYPFEQVEGESHDHPHHTGIFFTYDEVNESGFWNNTASPPQILHLSVNEMTNGEKGVLKTESQWISKNGTPLLLEERTMEFIPGNDETAIDFTFKLTASVDSVLFSDTKEGMFAIRVAHWLREQDFTGKYTSSNGDQGEKGVWGTRAKWVKLEGEIDGHKVGIAIINHPESVNYPTYWHARSYGLFSANPLGQYVFQKSKGEENPQRFDLTLKKDQSALFKFRMLIYDGLRSAEQLESNFSQYIQ